jgi:hypothetical protein
MHRSRTMVQNMETYHEGAYRCSRVGHADCCPDAPSERGPNVPGEFLIRVERLLTDELWSGLPPRARVFGVRDINLCLAASDYAGIVTLHEISETGLSTTVAKYADQYLAQGLPHRAYSVPCRPLREICGKYVHGDIHFLKIDAEGAEKSVLQGLRLQSL